MLRLRPFRSPDAKEIINWTSEPKEFYKWTAGIMGEYPVPKRDCWKQFPPGKITQNIFHLLLLTKTDSEFLTITQLHTTAIKVSASRKTE